MNVARRTLTFAAQPRTAFRLLRNGADWLVMGLSRICIAPTSKRHLSLIDRDPAAAKGVKGQPSSRDAAIVAGGATGTSKPGQWTVEDETTFSKKCDPYEQGGKALDAIQVSALIKTLDKGWSLSEDRKMLRCDWQSLELIAAVEFMRRVALLSQNEGHAPFQTSIENTQGRGAPHNITIVLYTPRLKGLSYADFMLALKISFLPPPPPVNKPS